MVVCVCVLVSQSYPTLCNPIDHSPPGPSVHGILQARTLECVAISFPKRNYRKKEREVAQLCPTLCNPMDCSLPGSSVHGIFQARVLEWGAISFSIYSNSHSILNSQDTRESISNTMKQTERFPVRNQDFTDNYTLDPHHWEVFIFT